MKGSCRRNAKSTTRRLRLLAMSTALEELSCSTLDMAHSEIQSDGLQTTYGMSMKFIDEKRRGMSKHVTALEKRLAPILKQKEDLNFVKSTIENWLNILHTTERWNSGVPILRSAKEGCLEITPDLNNTNSKFNQTVQNLSKANVPCLNKVQKGLKDLKKEIKDAFASDSTFNGKAVEDMRETMGHIVGVLIAILELYYN